LGRIQALRLEFDLCLQPPGDRQDQTGSCLKKPIAAMQNHLTGAVRHKSEKEQIKLVTG
jgi:hypothetical protein